MFKRNFFLQFPTISVTTTEFGRFYTVPTGEQYPSVTTVLSSEKSDSLDAWKKRVGEDEAKKIAQNAARRGTLVHDLSEEYLLGRVEDLSKINPYVLSLFGPLKKWFDQNLEELWAIEQPVFSHKLRVAGRTDIIAKLTDGKPAIVDLKTSTKEKKAEWIQNYFMQCAAYSYCIKEQSGILINRYVICLVNETSGTLRIFQGRCSDHIASFYQIRKKFDEALSLHHTTINLPVS